jgi:hypothetical protein
MVIAEEPPKHAKKEGAKLTDAPEEACEIKLVSLCLY